MTLLSIVQKSADIIGVARPNTVINNPDRTARQMLALLNRGGTVLARMKNAWGGGWQVLEGEHTFTTVIDRAFYELPDDFGGILADTVWNRDEYWSVRGPTSPMIWQALKSGLQVSSSIRDVFRIRRIAEATSGKRHFLIDPTPAAEEEFVFEYLSTFWVGNAADDEFTAEFEADTDIPLFPESLMEMDLIWRFKQAKGLDYGADLGEFEIERDRLIGAEVPAVVSIARRRFRLPSALVPETGFGDV